MSIVTGRNKQMNEGVIPAARKTRGEKRLMKEALINCLKTALCLQFDLLAMLLISMKLEDK